VNDRESKILFKALHHFENEKVGDNSTLDLALDHHDGWSKSNEKHCLKRSDVLALMAALGSGRPLLVTGEPGCGKSTMARAFASLMAHHFFGCMVKPGMSYESLLWQVDHVDRFAEAQMTFDSAEAKREALDLTKFIKPGAVWSAFQRVHKESVVLLLDEVDKAELTLVNGLLDVLDQGSFVGPNNRQINKGSNHSLIVVLTSNGDRPMPPAIIRRCALYEMKASTEPGEFVRYCRKIGAAKYPDLADQSVLGDAAEIIVKDRELDKAVKSGISEYVDLLRVWNEIRVNRDKDTANQHLKEISAYFIKQVR
jgi:MoxR-like ATPase